MADQRNGGIAYCTDSWSPVRGCSKDSPGCDNCFALGMARRFSGEGMPWHGLVRDGDWAGVSRLIPEHLGDPLHWRRPRRILVPTSGDLFHESLTFEQIDAVFGVMWACLYRSGEGLPGHTFLLLTKRARRMREYLSTDRRVQWAIQAALRGGGRDPDGIHDQVRYFNGPHPRIHLGVSVESNEYRWRIDELQQCPAAVRWVSAEPLLGELDLSKYLKPTLVANNGERLQHPDPRVPSTGGCWEWGLDHVVCGGESGPNARPLHPAWARSLRDQCKSAGVPFFFKQHGEFISTYDREVDDPGWETAPTVGKQHQPGQWLNLAGGMGFHGERAQWMKRVGKRAAGNLLDGHEYRMLPGDKW